MYKKLNEEVAEKYGYVLIVKSVFLQNGLYTKALYKKDNFIFAKGEMVLCIRNDIMKKFKSEDFEI